jgi:hypothetical protein
MFFIQRQAFCSTTLTLKKVVYGAECVKTMAAAASFFSRPTRARVARFYIYKPKNPKLG